MSDKKKEPDLKLKAKIADLYVKLEINRAEREAALAELQKLVPKAYGAKQ